MTTETKPTPYPKTIEFNTGEEGGEPITIKMTFGLLTELSKSFQNMEDFQMAIVDQDIMLDLTDICIAARGEDGKIDKKKSKSIRNLDPELAEYGRMTEWIMGHVLSFFATRTKAFVQATTSAESQIGDLALRLSKLKTG